MFEQRVRLALWLCAAIATVLEAAVLASSTSTRIALAVGVVAFAAVAGALDRRRRLQQLLEFNPCPKARLNAQRLGAKASAIARRNFPSEDPPYIRRDRYDDVLDAAMRNRRFVVVKGVTNSGKTRAVFEAIGRVFPERKIVLPRDPTEGTDALRELLQTGWLLPRFGRYVLVINDLENRLSALQGYAVRNWLRSHPRSRIVATLSAEHWAKLLAREQTPAARAATKLLGIAEEVAFGAEFNGLPLLKAREMYGLPPGKTRLGAYLVSAERAGAAFDATMSAGLGAARALALSGINCARAGLFRPVAVETLLKVAQHVSATDGRFFSESEWRDAVEYCTRNREGDGALLEVSRMDGDDRQLVTANPALVERIDRGSAGAGVRPKLPGKVWKAIVEIVADGPYDRLRIAAASGWRGRPDLARQLFEEVTTAGGKPGRIAESRLREPDRIDEPLPVTELLERASIGPDPRLRGPDSGRLAVPLQSTSGVFDPSVRKTRRWRRFYERQGARDLVRFPVLLCCDVIAVCAGIVVAERLGAVAIADSSGFDSSSVTVALVTAALVLTFFLLFGLYRADRERARLGEILKSTALAVIALSLWVIGKGFALINLPLAALAAAAASGLAFLFRWTYDHVSRAWVRRNGLQARVLLLASHRPTATAELILNGCRRPMQMIGYLSEKPLDEPGRLGGLDSLERIARQYAVDRVIIAEPDLLPSERLPLIYQCHALDLVTDIVPSGAELFQGSSHALDDMVVPLVRVRPLYLNYADKIAKRALDILIALPLSLLALVVLLPLGVVMKVRSPREPVLVWDQRPGLGAVLFPMWRLRTRRRDSLTKLGKLLERLRINELPQLINVFDGTMSLVGPRPLSREEFDGLDDFQRARNTVLPGITGLWQVARRRESSLEDMSSLDIVYCRKWTPMLDLTILLLTLPAIRTAPPGAAA